MRSKLTCKRKKAPSLVTSDKPDTKWSLESEGANGQRKKLKKKLNHGWVIGYILVCVCLYLVPVKKKKEHLR